MVKPGNYSSPPPISALRCKGPSRMGLQQAAARVQEQNKKVNPGVQRDMPAQECRRAIPPPAAP